MPKNRAEVIWDPDQKSVLFKVSEFLDTGQPNGDVCITPRPEIAALVSLNHAVFLSVSNLNERSHQVKAQFDAINTGNGSGSPQDVMNVVTQLVAGGGINGIKDAVVALSADIDALQKVFEQIIKTAEVMSEKAQHKYRRMTTGLTVVKGGKAT